MNVARDTKRKLCVDDSWYDIVSTAILLESRQEAVLQSCIGECPVFESISGLEKTRRNPRNKVVVLLDNRISAELPVTLLLSCLIFLDAQN